MKRGFRVMACVVMVAFLSACAKPPGAITAAYVSPGEYKGLSCDEIRKQMLETNVEVLRLTQEQSSAANLDVALLIIGLTLFWPVLIMLAFPSGNEVALSTAKGRLEAVKTTAAQMGCDVSDIPEAARKELEARLKKEMEKYEDKSRGGGEVLDEG